MSQTNAGNTGNGRTGDNHPLRKSPKRDTKNAGEMIDNKYEDRRLSKLSKQSYKALRSRSNSPEVEASMCQANSS